MLCVYSFAVSIESPRLFIYTNSILLNRSQFLAFDTFMVILFQIHNTGNYSDIQYYNITVQHQKNGSVASRLLKSHP